jgi:5-methylthioadenosine/S-adenosylhomocysteine deaminase
MTPQPIDPLAGPSLALAGRVVTMDHDFQVIPDGVVYIRQGEIAAVQERTRPAPPDFVAVPVTDTQGTMFPGLIELHNHLSYNALQLWDVPQAFTNRGQWGGIKEYRKLVSGPMTVIGKTPGLLPHLVRYVECKCLLGGVTTSQGIMLFSNQGVRRFYRGIVRNVEQTDDEENFPQAATRIADVDASDPEKFFRALSREKTCYLLHLAEGIDEAANRHFQALFDAGNNRWMITPQLAGIHCTGLHPPDFDTLASHGGAMIWSPLSNLLLYGKTADIAAAKQAGVRLGLGCDWSPSGSKNLLGELKVAKLSSQAAGGICSDVELVAMATRGPAAILKWDKKLGSLEAGKRADVLVVAGQTGDPYSSLISAPETAIRLVLINGTARYGVPELMGQLSPGGEKISIGGQARQIFLQQQTQDPDVAAVTLAEAVQTLQTALHDLPDLAKALEQPQPPRAARPLDYHEPVVWYLALDEIEERGVDLRPRLPLAPGGPLTGPGRLMITAAAPLLSTILEPMSLDALTVADDADFLSRLKKERNLPDLIKQELPGLY